jgi:glycosyltransferase involved in cell wall biosynthesis
MRILWFKWKDVRHPDSGGAEIVSHDLMRRLAAAGHQVTTVTARYPGAGERDVIDGVAIRRVGNRVSHYVHAARLFATELRGEADLVVEEVNTVPYFLSFVPGAPRVVLFYHQLAREIWFYQMRLPLSLVGYGMEAVYTWLQGRSGNHVVTVSEDSKADLIRFGFDPLRVHVVTEGIANPPLDNVDPARKERRFTVLFHSSLRPMKRPMEMLKAFEVLARDAPDARLWVSGGGDQSALRAFSAGHGLADRVTFFGRTSEETKLDLMRRATVLCSTSVKEGWGLVVTEANSMGTPAVVYDVDGLRNASSAGGNWTVKPDATALAERLRDLRAMFLDSRSAYDAWCVRVHSSSRRFSPEQCYREFAALVDGGDAERGR